MDDSIEALSYCIFFFVPSFRLNRIAHLIIQHATVGQLQTFTESRKHLVLFSIDCLLD